MFEVSFWPELIIFMGRFLHQDTLVLFYLQKYISSSAPHTDNQLHTNLHLEPSVI